MPAQLETSALLIDLMIVIGFGLVTLFAGWFLRGLFRLHLTTTSPGERTETAAGIIHPGPESKEPQPVAPAETNPASSQTVNVTAEAINARSALTELHELTKSVATNVDEHQSQVVSINEQIKSAQKGDPDAVAALVTQLVEANERVQQELQSAESKLQEQSVQLEEHARDARTDVLTGLLNRRGLDDLLDEQLAEFQTTGTPVSVMMTDVDHFKKFNDTYGHQAGDEVLRGVGRVLRECCGERDVPARYGGEEFAVIFPRTSYRDAAARADTVRTYIQDSVFRHERTDLRVTCSVGLAQLTPSENIELLIKRSDDALYASKEAGRNCSHWHDGKEIHPFDLPRQPALTRPSGDQTTTAQSDPSPPPNNPASMREKSVVTEPIAEEPITEPVSSVATAVSANGRSANIFPAFQQLAGTLEPESFQSEVAAQIEAYSVDADPVSLMLVAMDVEYIDIPPDDDATWYTLMRATLQLVKAAVRTSDVLGQHNGHTFSILMPATTLTKSTQIAERLRRAISRCALPIMEGGLRFTVSVGVSDVQDTDQLPDLRDRCENALQAAISSGGNRTAMHDGERCRFIPDRNSSPQVAAS